MKQGLYLICGAETPDPITSFAKEKAGRPDALLCDPAGMTDAELRKFAAAVQAENVAFIVKNDVETALRIGADGVQIDYRPDIKKIRSKIGDIALGVLCATRDEAMRAGEAGADYIGFDGENAKELTEWWAELFNLPCVDFNPSDSSDSADFRVKPLGG
ncbi:MAG TPA: hypothetical protein DCX19_01755 [Alphaproteobacteria bacterium]|nr:hypothetical protein [Alphaproteobacteria bacterium]